MKCEVCSVNLKSEEMIDKGGYYLCPACNTSVENRRAEAYKVIPPVTKNKPSYVLDERELYGLRAMKLVTPRTYVYLALRLDGIHRDMKEIDIPAFCERWGLLENDFVIAIAMLNKKGVVDLEVPKVKTRAFSYQEKINSLENEVSN